MTANLQRTEWQLLLSSIFIRGTDTMLLHLCNRIERMNPQLARELYMKELSAPNKLYAKLLHESGLLQKWTLYVEYIHPAWIFEVINESDVHGAIRCVLNLAYYVPKYQQNWLSSCFYQRLIKYRSFEQKNYNVVIQLLSLNFSHTIPNSIYLKLHKDVEKCYKITWARTCVNIAKQCRPVDHRVWIVVEDYLRASSNILIFDPS